MKSKLELLQSQDRIILYADVLVELFVLNIFTTFFNWNIIAPRSPNSIFIAANAAYLVGVYSFSPIFHKLRVHRISIIGRVFKLWLVFSITFTLELLFLQARISLFKVSLTIYFFGILALFVTARLLAYKYLRYRRNDKWNFKEVVFVGSSSNLEEIYKSMYEDVTYGYSVLGYFDDSPKESFLNGKLPYLGKPETIDTWLIENNQTIKELYCALPSNQGQIITRIINFCEENVIRFFSVPNIRNYLKRQMHVAFYGDTPVLTLREMPLQQISNRIVKRLLDVGISAVFLIFFFPFIWLIVGCVMKLTMPGPIFFKQKRSGLYGQDFTCYKFRSMKVNNTSDEVQATKDDPRKTKFGEFMRHYNIDELPQFWNVLKGNMSIVGPRPHMLYHTEMYSNLIPKYMVRHFAKPGITGWAQVTGSRGETKEVWQMQERIQKDIWYIEHWSLGLDLRIIWLTFWNIVSGNDEKAY